MSNILRIMPIAVKRNVEMAAEVGPLETASTGASTRPLSVTVCAKAGGELLSKRLSLNEDGKLFPDGSPCKMSSGRARRHLLDASAPATSLASLLAGLGSHEAIVLGDYAGEAESIALTLKSWASPENGRHGRTRETFSFAPGRPAAMLVDFDTKAMPPAVAERLEALGGFVGALRSLLPDFDALARVTRSSTSSGVSNAENGELFDGSGGIHLYLFVEDGSDIGRALGVLAERAWLAGLGWYMVGATGNLLPRTIVDVSVGLPERLVFEGAPELVPPLVQDQEARRPVAVDGRLLDTRSALLPLSDDEKSRHTAILRHARLAVEPEANARRKAAVEAKSRQHGLSMAEAERLIEASSRGVLYGQDVLIFDELGAVAVAAVLEDPARFHGKTLADPADPDDGRGKAKLYDNGGGHVVVNSFAHGGGKWRLHYSVEEVEAAIQEAGADAVNVLSAMSPAAKLTAVERWRLRDTAAKLAKVGKRVVDSALREAEAEAENEQRELTGEDEDEDQRPLISLLDGTRSEALEAIGEELRRAENVAVGAVLDRGGALVVLKRLPDPLKIGAVSLSRGTIQPLPAVAENMQAQCDRLLRFVGYTAAGVPKAKDCPLDLARSVAANVDLPSLASVGTAPVILDDGAILEQPGYHAASGIFYAPERRFLPVPEEPTQEEAEAALELLLRPFRGFEFVTETDRAAVAVEVLTLLARHLLPCAPAFMHSAAEPGSGKTMVFRAASLIATGAEPATLAGEVLQDEDELRKNLTTLALVGSTTALFDNARRGEVVKSTVLNAYLTSAVYGDRLLGGNKQLRVKTAAVVCVTGNAIDPAGDMVRRTIKLSLCSSLERPEERTFDFDAIEEVERDRAELVAAALTLLRFRIRCNRPVHSRAMLGSFKAWDDLCVGAVIQAGGPDVVSLLESTRANDPERDNLREVLDMLLGIGAEAIPLAKRAGQIIEAVKLGAAAPGADGERYRQWLEALGRIGGGEPSAASLGRYLKNNTGRIVDGVSLVAREDKKAGSRRFAAYRKP